MWRGEESVRHVAALVENLPPEAAVWRGSREAPTWALTPTDVLLMDVYHALTGEPHPSRPKPARSTQRAAEVAARLRAQRERLAREENPSGD